MHQTGDCTKLTIERRQIPTTNMEPLPDRGTQNQQPSRGLTQQTKEESEDGTSQLLQDHRRIKKEQAANEVKMIQYSAGGKKIKPKNQQLYLTAES